MEQKKSSSIIASAYSGLSIVQVFSLCFPFIFLLLCIYYYYGVTNWHNYSHIFAWFLFILVFFGLIRASQDLMLIPHVTILQNDVLKTKGFFGEKRVSLKELTQIKSTIINRSYGLSPPRGFELIDKSGQSLVIHLGSVPKVERIKIIKKLLPYLSKRTVTKPDDFQRIINRWFWFRRASNFSEYSQLDTVE